jgi:hypothetical protein
MGIWTAAASETDTSAALRSLEPQIADWDCGLLVVFFGRQHDPELLSAALQEAHPTATIVGASTMGEIGPLGLTQGGVSVLGLGGTARASAALLPPLEDLDFPAARQLLDALAGDLDSALAALEPDKHVVLLLVDGLSPVQDRATGALGLAAGNIPLVGGGAADGQAMEQTCVLLGDRVQRSGSVVVLVEPGVPFETFALHHYGPTDQRLVVTEVGADSRVVLGFNGRPAVDVMVELAGLEPGVLEQDPWAISGTGLTLGLRAGHRMFLRAPMRAEAGGIRFASRVSVGTVLRVMAPGALADETRAQLVALDERLPGGCAGALAFNCGGRLLAAMASDTVPELEGALGAVPMAGFSTYSEQIGPLLVNHTLTGIAFGR